MSLGLDKSGYTPPTETTETTALDFTSATRSRSSSVASEGFEVPEGYHLIGEGQTLSTAGKAHNFAMDPTDFQLHKYDAFAGQNHSSRVKSNFRTALLRSHTIYSGQEFSLKDKVVRGISKFVDGDIITNTDRTGDGHKFLGYTSPNGEKTNAFMTDDKGRIMNKSNRGIQSRVAKAQYKDAKGILQKYNTGSTFLMAKVDDMVAKVFDRIQNAFSGNIVGFCLAVLITTVLRRAINLATLVAFKPLHTIAALVILALSPLAIPAAILYGIFKAGKWCIQNRHRFKPWVLNVAWPNFKLGLKNLGPMLLLGAKKAGLFAGRLLGSALLLTGVWMLFTYGAKHYVEAWHVLWGSENGPVSREIRKDYMVDMLVAQSGYGDIEATGKVEYTMAENLGKSEKAADKISRAKTEKAKASAEKNYIKQFNDAFNYLASTLQDPNAKNNLGRKGVASVEVGLAELISVHTKASHTLTVEQEKSIGSHRVNIDKILTAS